MNYENEKKEFEEKFKLPDLVDTYIDDEIGFHPASKGVVWQHIGLLLKAERLKGKIEIMQTLIEKDIDLAELYTGAELVEKLFTVKILDLTKELNELKGESNAKI